VSSPAKTAAELPAIVQALQARNEALFMASKAKEAELAELRLQGPSLFQGSKRPWMIARVAMKFLPPLRKMWHRRVVHRSGLFDPVWYLNRYPDLQQTGVNPLKHFVAHGGHDRRDPSAAFSTGAYLDLNPDVATSGMNPLVHFLTQGWMENRETRRVPVHRLRRK